MAFTAKDVQTLRERTGCGMMDCKKALAASDGDFDKAIEFLREKGLAAAAKKAGRIAAEGAVFANVDENGIGVIVEINSETDFVAKNANFQEFCRGVAAVIAKDTPADIEALKACKYGDTDLTVEQTQQEKVLTIGENIQIRRFERYCDCTQNVSYIHMGGKIGVLIGLEVSDNLKNNPAVIELGKDICMQIAAMSPQWLNPEAVPAETVEKEKEILMAQTISEGKPAAVAEKIVAGRIGKFYGENCLIKQAFVKDSKFTVEGHIRNVASELGGTISVARFVRFEKGEGIAKKEEDFAAEIAKLTQN